MPISINFNPGKISDVQLRDPVFVKTQFDTAVRAVAERDQELVLVNARQLAAATELLTVKQALATESLRAAGLEDQIKRFQTDAPKIAIQELVTQFKSDIDKINRDVLANPTLAGMLVDSVEVEVKGGIDVSQGVRFSQLPHGELTGASASTFRFNLKPSAVVRIVDDP